jgi:SUKH-3 immunity protein
MSSAAERTLEEFGGIQASRSGPGLDCARGAFVLDPELADGEEERFASFSNLVAGALFPIGEAYDGHAFLGIDEAGVVYLVGDSLHRLGENIYCALDAVLEGRLPCRVVDMRDRSPSPDGKS